MSGLYRTETIETVEQLAVLPADTIMRARTGALCRTGMILGDPCVWEEGWLTFEDAVEHLAPLAAFVPEEAVEEVLTEDTFAGSEQLRRWVTPWKRFKSGGAQ